MDGDRPKMDFTFSAISETGAENGRTFSAGNQNKNEKRYSFSAENENKTESNQIKQQHIIMKFLVLVVCNSANIQCEIRKRISYIDQILNSNI